MKQNSEQHGLPGALEDALLGVIHYGFPPPLLVNSCDVCHSSMHADKCQSKNRTPRPPPAEWRSNYGA
jgi:hypothetical protein